MQNFAHIVIRTVRLRFVPRTSVEPHNGRSSRQVEEFELAFPARMAHHDVVTRQSHVRVTRANAIWLNPSRRLALPVP